MELNGKKLLVCDCNGTMPLDGKALSKACAAAGGTGSDIEINTLLCRTQLGNFEAAIKSQAPVIVACTQEAPLFAEIRAEDGVDTELSFVNIREHAGWSAEGGAVTPKIAALLAEAAIDVEPPPAIGMKSSGVTLVYGRDEVAIEAAQQIADRLDCTVLLRAPGAIVPPNLANVPIFTGIVAAAKGHLGAFEIVVNGYAPSLPSARGALQFEVPRDGASSTCDLILDLSGGTPLFTAHDKRDGYFRADPGDPAAVQRALFELVETVGEFEKPLYVAYDSSLCTHSRNRKTGCTRCLDVCPTGAITPNGDHVAIDPYVCAGCGSCASVCPTGAAAYALPARDALLDRVRTLLLTYAKAGGTAPLLLVHDGTYGEEMLAAIARHGRGLPARALPFRVNAATQIGFDFFAAALAYGASQVRILVDPKRRDELAGLAAQIGLAETALSGLGYGPGRVSVLDDADPDTIEATLYAAPIQIPPKAGSFLPMGGKRGVTLLALRHLHAAAPQPIDILPLAPGSPFGNVEVNAEGCTLCLSCVSACPTGALIDNPERPMLRFIEEACVQCGLCRITCPEKVIDLKPRFNFTAEAKSPALKKEEEPALCLKCGKPFGTKGTIDKVMAKLANKNWMYGNQTAINRMMMCGDCRLIAQNEEGMDPFTGPNRPVPRTTEDYLREREIDQAREALKAGPVPGGPPKLNS